MLQKKKEKRFDMLSCRKHPCLSEDFKQSDNVFFVYASMDVKIRDEEQSPKL